jgi:metal-responsive CopG/Arc/MetJ family transcriptional regulator
MLAKLDLAAQRAGMSRSELLRQVVEEWMEREAEERWVAEKAAEALAEERMPWAETRADLGL